MKYELESLNLNKISTLVSIHKLIHGSNHFSLEEYMRKTDAHLIYLIKVNDSLKIGRTGDSKTLKRRMKSLSGANSNNIELICVIQSGYNLTESSLHIKFKHLRIKNEWFKYSDEILEEFRKLWSLDYLSRRKCSPYFGINKDCTILTTFTHKGHNERIKFINKVNSELNLTIKKDLFATEWE